MNNYKPKKFKITAESIRNAVEKLRENESYLKCFRCMKPVDYGVTFVTPEGGIRLCKACGDKFEENKFKL